MHAAVRDHAAPGEAVIVSYLFLSICLSVTGLAVVITAAVAVTRARERRELARRKGELSSEQELEQFIGRVDQALSDDELNRLENEGKDSS